MWLPKSSARVARPLLRWARYRPRISASVSAGASWITVMGISLQRTGSVARRSPGARQQGVRSGQHQRAAVEVAQQRFGGGAPGRRMEGEGAHGGRRQGVRGTADEVQTAEQLQGPGGDPR